MTRELNAEGLPAIHLEDDGVPGPSVQTLADDGLAWPISGDAIRRARLRVAEDVVERANRPNYGIEPRVWLSDIVEPLDAPDEEES